MTPTPILELDDVTRRFPTRGGWLPRLLGRTRDVAAVNQVSLAVPRGAALGLVGESGCGKSTLANLILRLDDPTSGRIRFDGQDITALHGKELLPFRRRAQMVFQDTGASLNPRKEVGRILGESLLLAGSTESDIPELLRVVGLDAELAGLHAHQLSGGQRQRVAIARALAMKPDLLVADEPVSALDVSLQAQILRLLMQLREQFGLTLVFISHDLAMVHHLCDHVAVMQAGRIVERGPTAEVLHAPAHPYTRQLLDAVPAAPEKSPT